MSKRNRHKPNPRTQMVIDICAKLRMIDRMSWDDIVLTLADQRIAYYANALSCRQTLMRGHQQAWHEACRKYLDQLRSTFDRAMDGPASTVREDCNVLHRTD